MKRLLKDRSSWFLVALVIYLGLIFTLSHIPGAVWAKVGIRLWDKVVHAAEYVPVGFLLMGWLLSRPGALARQARTLIVSVSLVVVLGGLDEVHQIFVSGRQASLGDMAADALGGSIGALTGMMIFNRLRSRTTWRARAPR